MRIHSKMHASALRITCAPRNDSHKQIYILWCLVCAWRNCNGGVVVAGSIGRDGGFCIVFKSCTLTTFDFSIRHTYRFDTNSIYIYTFANSSLNLGARIDSRTTSHRRSAFAIHKSCILWLNIRSNITHCSCAE